jgi:hypothetical protein
LLLISDLIIIAMKMKDYVCRFSRSTWQLCSFLILAHERERRIEKSFPVAAAAAAAAAAATKKSRKNERNEVDCRTTLQARTLVNEVRQGHLVKGEDTETFSSPLWS